MLLSLATIKTYLKITGTDDDAFLTYWGEVMTDAIEVFCRRKFNLATYVETMYRDDVNPTQSVHLFHYPVVAVTEVKLDDDIETDYRVQRDSGLLFRKCGFFTWNDKLEVTYSAGYAEADLPPTIKYAFLSLVEEKYNRKKAGVDINFGSDVQRISIPSTISIDFDYTLTNNEANNEMGNLLGNYLNVLSYYKSERAITPQGKVTYVD